MATTTTTQAATKPLGGLFGTVNPVGSVINAVTGVIKSISQIKLAKQWQDFKIALAKEEQQFKQELAATTQAQSSANQSQQTLQDLYLTSSKNQSNSLLITSGIIVVGGIALILILNKKSD